MHVDELLSRLEGVTGGSGQWYARCPAHDDRQASLAIAIGRDGRKLLTCWAGCELDDIVRAIDVTVADLFADENGGASVREWSARPLAVALGALAPTELDVGRWRDNLLADAGLVERVRELKGWPRATLAVLDIGMRGDRLTIPVRTPAGEIVAVLRYWPESHPKMLATRGTPRTPYYALADDDGVVWIVEGETDAIAMAAMGFNVIGAPGASAKARVEWLDVIKGRDVIVCMDADDPGRRASKRWGHACREAGAASVCVVELEGPTGYDVGNVLLEAGDPDAGRARLLELAEGASELEQVRVAPTRGANSTRPVLGIVSETHDELVERAKPGELILRSLSTIAPEPLRMLWRDRIPRGRVGIIFGPPGQGKSTLIGMLASDVTRAGGRVLIASAEDDPATTIVPRMVAADADLGLVDLMSTRASKGETSLVLPRDLDALAERMRGIDLLVIDPLSAHLGDDVNAWSDQSVRAQVLAPLAMHARAADCAVAMLMHLNKSQGSDPLSRITGSGGFGAAARFALLLGYHPGDIWLDEPERRLVLVHVKASESAKQLAMIFRRARVGVDVGGEVAALPVLELVESQASITAEAVVERPTEDEQGALADAVEYLRGELADGPKLSKQLLKVTRERGDFGERTLRKAKRSLDVRSIKDAEGWWWERPPVAGQ